MPDERQTVESVSADRSAMMALIRGSDTLPELRVRRWLHRHGYRFRLHRRDLPGTPDIVMPRYRIAILVHGCFWHRHPGCRRATMPKTRKEYWEPKLVRNVERDHKVQRALEDLGWRVSVVWECNTKTDEAIEQSLFPLVMPRMTDA